MYIAWEQFTENYSDMFKTPEQAVQYLIDSHASELDDIKILKVTNLVVEASRDFEITGKE